MYEYDLYYNGEHLCSDEFHTEREVIAGANEMIENYMYSDPERYNNEDLFKIECRKKGLQK